MNMRSQPHRGRPRKDVSDAPPISMACDIEWRAMARDGSLRLLQGYARYYERHVAPKAT